MTDDGPAGEIGAAEVLALETHEGDGHIEPRAVVDEEEPTASVGVVALPDGGGDRVAAVEQVTEAPSPPSPPPGHEDGARRTGWRARWASPHDAAIVGLAVPALGSLLLDPILSLVDTSEYV